MKSDNLEIGYVCNAHSPNLNQTQDVGVMREIMPGDCVNASREDGLSNQVEKSPCLRTKCDDRETGGSLPMNMSFGLKRGPSSESNLVACRSREPTIVQNEVHRLLQSKEGLLRSFFFANVASHTVRA